MNQIVEHGKVTRGYLGVHIQDVTPELAKQFGLNQGGGVLIGDVSADTPAAKAGLKSGDVDHRSERPAGGRCQPTAGADLADGAWNSPSR